MKYRANRRPCSFHTAITVGTQARIATLVNISLSGALVQGLGRVRPGERVSFMLGNQRIDGRAARTTPNGDVGIAFLRPLNSAQLGLVRQVVHTGGAAGRGTRHAHEL